MADGVAIPAGDPAELLTLASQLETLATETGYLGTSTRQTAAGVVDDANWTGSAADGFSAFADNLGKGASAAQGPLADIATAVRGYADQLSTAQQQAQAYSAIAEAAQHDTSGSLLSQAEQAGLQAMDANQALQQAATQAAAKVSAAASDLDGLFGNGPVQTWINSQPLLGEDFPAGGGFLGTFGTAPYSLPPDLKLPVGDPIPPDLGLPQGDPIPPDLGLPEGDPIPPDLGLPVGDPIPPGLLGPLINYDANPDDTPGDDTPGADDTPGSGTPAPEDGTSNRVRPPVSGDTNYQVYDPDDPGRTITDIDKIDGGTLVEQKTATGQDPRTDIPAWVQKHVTTKLDEYDEASQYMPGYENAPIRMEFTESGATPQFRSAVEQAVSQWQAAHPGSQVTVQWEP